MEEGYLNPLEREWILCQAGCPEQTIVQVEAQVNEIIAHRRESNEVDFSYMIGLGDLTSDEVEERVDCDAESEEEAVVNDVVNDGNPEVERYDDLKRNSMNCNAEPNSNTDRKHRPCVSDRGKESVYDHMDTAFQPQPHVCNDPVAA